MGESHGEREPHFDKRRKHGMERVSSTLRKGEFQGGRRGQAKRASPGKAGESMSG